MSVYARPNNETMAKINVNGLVTDNLVLFLDAGRKYSYDGLGATWTDLSTNNRDVTLYNAGGTTYSSNPPGPPTFTESSLGVFTFDGTNDFGRMTQFTITSTTSVTAWIKTSVNSATRRGIFSHCNGGPVGMCYSIKSGKMLFYYYHTAWKEVLGTTTVTDDTWKNLCWTTNGTALKMYINGTEDATATLDAAQSYSMNCIGSEWGPCNSDSYGAGTDNYGNVFSGSIAMVMVHSKTLSAVEVAQNFANTRRRFGL